MSIDDFAFPRQPHYAREGDTQYFFSGGYGMTLRDYFAGQVIAVLLTHLVRRPENPWSVDAEDAYRIADAMLKARGGT